MHPNDYAQVDSDDESSVSDYSVIISDSGTDVGERCCGAYSNHTPTVSDFVASDDATGKLGADVPDNTTPSTSTDHWPGWWTSGLLVDGYGTATDPFHCQGLQCS